MFNSIDIDECKHLTHSATTEHLFYKKTNNKVKVKKVITIIIFYLA